LQWIDRARELPPLKRFDLFGLSGSIVVLLAVLVPMAAYVGRAGERYSPLNHFISELGEVGVSSLALVFNAGSIVAGVLYVPFILGLGAAVRGGGAAAGTLAGLVSASALACVGFFPMNDFTPHIAAAVLFFRSGLVTVLLFGIAIQRQRPGRRVIDRRANVASGAAVLAFAVFLAWMGLQPVSASDFQIPAARPAVWTGAILEWTILVAMIAWFFVVSACRRGPNRLREPGGPGPA